MVIRRFSQGFASIAARCNHETAQATPKQNLIYVRLCMAGHCCKPEDGRDARGRAKHSIEFRYPEGREWRQRLKHDIQQNA